MTDDFQRAARRQGWLFEQFVETGLLMEGWKLVAKNWREPLTGCEIDRVMLDPGGVEWWIECKGSWEGREAAKGARRGDTVKKAIGVAWMLSRLNQRDRRPYMLVVSHKPTARVPRKMLDAALEDGLFTAVRQVGLGDSIGAL